MTSTPTRSVEQQALPHNATSQWNWLGLAGFITSIIGILTCGLFSPVALILSLIGLMRPPRGLAIAGTVLGVIGSVGCVMPWITLPALAAARNAANAMKTKTAMRLVATTIEAQKAGGQAVPNQAAGEAMVRMNMDAWGQPMGYELQGNTYVITSLGHDGKPGTADDIRMTPAELGVLMPPARP